MQHHVMLWGLTGDPPLDAVRQEFTRHRVPYLMVDQRELHSIRLDANSTNGVTGTLTLDREVVGLDEFSAVFVRRYDIRDVLAESLEVVPDGVPAAATESAATRSAATHSAASRSAATRSTATRSAALELEQQLLAWTDITDTFVVNRPSAMMSNTSKPYQGELIRRGGFAVPSTLVTTTPEVARAFVAQHRQVIYKSVSAERSMVTRVSDADGEPFDDVANCPTQLQAYVAGTDWRVHVVGDDLFACEIRCTADDYRTAEMQGIPIDVRTAPLPEPIATRCHALAHALALPLAGLDLRRTDHDEWFCFEVNPSPAFTYYEQRTKQPLSAAVAQLLVEGRNDTRRQPVDFP